MSNLIYIYFVDCIETTKSRKHVPSFWFVPLVMVSGRQLCILYNSMDTDSYKNHAAYHLNQR